ncbi:MAG: HIT family protein [Caulobacteraceae bacterium]|nr:HIT family protein [Caulobacteraceae bacterium]
MSLHGAYDPDNIFARIVRGDMPSVKVWEDEKVLAFMDVFPQAPGHVLVVHKLSRARNILEIEPHELTELAAAVQKTARAVERALKPDGLTVMQFNGEAGGQTVFHLHVHVIPRREGESLGRHGGGMADMDELKAQAAAIAAAL